MNPITAGVVIGSGLSHKILEEAARIVSDPPIPTVIGRAAASAGVRSEVAQAVANLAQTDPSAAVKKCAQAFADFFVAVAQKAAAQVTMQAAQEVQADADLVKQRQAEYGAASADASGAIAKAKAVVDDAKAKLAAAKNAYQKQADALAAPSALGPAQAAYNAAQTAYDNAMAELNAATDAPMNAQIALEAAQENELNARTSMGAAIGAIPANASEAVDKAGDALNKATDAAAAATIHLHQSAAAIAGNQDADKFLSHGGDDASLEKLPVDNTVPALGAARLLGAVQAAVTLGKKLAETGKTATDIAADLLAQADKLAKSESETASKIAELQDKVAADKDAGRDTSSDEVALHNLKQKMMLAHAKVVQLRGQATNRRGKAQDSADASSLLLSAAANSVPGLTLAGLALPPEVQTEGAEAEKQNQDTVQLVHDLGVVVVRIGAKVKQNMLNAKAWSQIMAGSVDSNDTKTNLPPAEIKRIDPTYGTTTRPDDHGTPKVGDGDGEKPAESGFPWGLAAAAIAAKLLFF